ncbi:MAG: tetratricopeptide repeat protein [Planctomycetes bacterium]|nr:tetratricopeptide repeat protein [Planctomycetota bacterium]
MRPTTPRPPLARLAGGLLLLLAAATAQAGAVVTDAVHLKTAKDPIIERGTILAESMDGIEIQTAQGKGSFPLSRIIQVDYGDSPEAYKRGHDRREQGIYREAITYFENAPRTPNARKFWIEPASLYFAGLCYLEEGADLDAAQAKFRELLQAHPQSRWVPDAMLGLGKALFAAKKWDPALAQFGSLAKLAIPKGDTPGWSDWLATASLWQGKTYLEAKRPDEAMKCAKKVLAVITDPKHDLYIQGKMLEAMVLLEQSEPEKAVAELTDLIKRLAPRVADEVEHPTPTARMQRTEAQCHNALGQALLKQHAKTKKDEDLRGALLAFLWTVVLYPRAQFVPEHMEALYFASQCFDRLKEKARAAELMRELTDRYPENPYTRVPGAVKAGAPRKETDK